MQLGERGTYLGVEVGPAAGSCQWESVGRKLAARLPDISGASKLAGRIVSSLFSFKGQSADADAPTKRRYEHAVQCSSRSPWHAFPSALLYNIKALHFPVEVRDLGLLIFESQVRTLRTSLVWDDVQRPIREIDLSDVASLNFGPFPTMAWRNGHCHLVAHCIPGVNDV